MGIMSFKLLTVMIITILILNPQVTISQQLTVSEYAILMMNVSRELVNIAELFVEEEEPALYDVLVAKDKLKNILTRLVLVSPPSEFRDYHFSYTLCLFYVYASFELYHRGRMSRNETLMDAADVLGEEFVQCTRQTIPKLREAISKYMERMCDPSYPDVCIPPPPPDLDCKDIPYRNFRVLPPDPHHFDADRDGIGCET